MENLKSVQPLTKILPVVPFSGEVAQELLAIYGSPVYVYQSQKIQDTIQQITNALIYPQTRLCFASVTNGNVALLQIFQRAGWGLHANAPGDVYLGLKAGFNPKQIVYSGSNLSRAEMEQMLDWQVGTFNLDSLAQLELLADVWQNCNSDFTPLLGLRLNLPEITGDSRIGVHPEEFPHAIALVQSTKLKLSGLHFYRGTGTNATTAFIQVIDTIIRTAQKLPDWEYLDFGGGFGYPYRAEGVAFDWVLFGNELNQKLSSLERQVNLIIEPGRAAISSAATLLAKVISVKWQEEKQIIGTDTSIANLAVLSVHGGYREIVSWQNLSAAKSYLTDVCGNTTYSRDYLGKNCQLPALQIGDIIGILDVGAYGYAMSSHFLHRPRPAEVLLTNHQHRLIRQREDYSALLQNQVWESEENYGFKVY